MLSTAFDLILVILGFGLIIFLHELGHFLAARWAGIRVLAFAVGFGGALASYRKGMGITRGSSEREYLAALKASGKPVREFAVSPTEYRLNWMPFGGYVKMLGQEDLNPEAVSAEKDSYQNTPPWKRMIVISAGVVMNLITAGILFMIVFKVGLKTEPPIIGQVLPGSPAALAIPDPPINSAASGITSPGLKPGDVVLEVNGRPCRQFNDLTVATAMASRGTPVKLLVERPASAAGDQPRTLTFNIVARPGTISRLMEIGVGPAPSLTLPDIPEDQRELFDAEIARLGLAGVKPGMTLVRIGDNASPRSPLQMDEALTASSGTPIEVEFLDRKSGERVVTRLEGKPRAESTLIAFAAPASSSSSAVPAPFAFEHLLGLAPVMKVETPTEAAQAQGLRAGDVFARLGSLEFPSIPAGIHEVGSHAGKTIEASVLRRPTPGQPAEEVALSLKVTNEGKIGFSVGDTGQESTRLAATPVGASVIQSGESAGPLVLPAMSVVSRAGTRILAINDQPVGNFAEIRAALMQAIRPALDAKAQQADVRLRLAEPFGEAGIKERDAAWSLDLASMQRFAALGWASRLDPAAFELEQTVLKATGPIDAINMGLGETRRVMVMTYLTFARLFEGTVKVEHLKGPVGIAHLGTRIAERGTIWLLFFLALVSVNLAVINFLPLPIVDGGQFIFLLIEQIRGKPVPVAIQNIATLAGLALIIAVFGLVTFNDIARLLG